MLHMKPQFFYSIITLVVASCAYIYTTFATIDYVDDKHQEVKDMFQEQRVILDRIDERVYKLNERNQ